MEWWIALHSVMGNAKHIRRASFVRNGIRNRGTRRKQYAMQPAARIINDIFDGPPTLAKRLKVHKSTVYRCLKPKDVGGTGGEVPARLQKKMMSLARDLGKPLDYSDFHIK